MFRPLADVVVTVWLRRVPLALVLVTVSMRLPSVPITMLSVRVTSVTPSPFSSTRVVDERPVAEVMVAVELILAPVESKTDTVSVRLPSRLRTVTSVVVPSILPSTFLVTELDRSVALTVVTVWLIWLPSLADRVTVSVRLPSAFRTVLSVVAVSTFPSILLVTVFDRPSALVVDIVWPTRLPSTA